MKKLEDGIILYHGSYCLVETPDLAKCAMYKDFGQGFFLQVLRNRQSLLQRFQQQRRSLKG